MASPTEHALNVLGGIIPNRRDLLEKALHQLSTSHFEERTHAAMFAFLQRYSDQTAGAVMPMKFLGDLLRERGSAAGQAIQFEELFEQCEEHTVADSDFIWSVQQLRELAASKATGEAFTEGMEILRTGREENGTFLSGHEDARQHVLEKIQAADRELNLQDAPEGDMREESSDMLVDYADRKRAREQGTSTGILFGISDLDRKVGGMQPGELVIAAGYSSDGKSTLCVQAAWSAAVEQGKNVVFFTTETLRPQIRRKILSRHSKLPQFDLPEGLNTRDLKAGTLTPEEEQKLPTIVNDLAKNPAYGRLYIAQVPRSATVQSLELRISRIKRRFEIDLVIVDYLALFRALVKRGSQREELSEILKEAKLLAVAAGVPLMSPWQVSRDARTQAENSGGYTTRALSETAEATNSADIIIGLLAPTDNTDRYCDVVMQVLKNRDGETANNLTVAVDYATSMFRSRSLGLDNLSPSPSGGVGGRSDFSMESLLT